MCTVRLIRTITMNYHQWMVLNIDRLTLPCQKPSSLLFRLENQTPEQTLDKHLPLLIQQHIHDHQVVYHFFQFQVEEKKYRFALILTKVEMTNESVN